MGAFCVERWLRKSPTPERSKPKRVMITTTPCNHFEDAWNRKQMNATEMETVVGGSPKKGLSNQRCNDRRNATLSRWSGRLLGDFDDWRRTSLFYLWCKSQRWRQTGGNGQWEINPRTTSFGVLRGNDRPSTSYFYRWRMKRRTWKGNSMSMGERSVLRTELDSLPDFFVAGKDVKFRRVSDACIGGLLLWCVVLCFTSSLFSIVFNWLSLSFSCLFSNRLLVSNWSDLRSLGWFHLSSLWSVLHSQTIILGFLFVFRNHDMDNSLVLSRYFVFVHVLAFEWCGIYDCWYECNFSDCTFHFAIWNDTLWQLAHRKVGSNKWKSACKLRCCRQLTVLHQRKNEMPSKINWVWGCLAVFFQCLCPRRKQQGRRDVRERYFGMSWTGSWTDNKMNHFITDKNTAKLKPSIWCIVDTSMGFVALRQKSKLLTWNFRNWTLKRGKVEFLRKKSETKESSDLELKTLVCMTIFLQRMNIFGRSCIIWERENRAGKIFEMHLFS